MSAKHSIAIADDVRAVLTQSTISDVSLRLPSQLDRKLYERVNKVLVAAGGKWHRVTGSHVWPRGTDPRIVLGLALTAGAIVDQKKAKQQFFTPVPLAEQMAVLANIECGVSRVLEPSAGSGRIAAAIYYAGGILTCIELDEALATALHYQVVHDDFLKVLPAEFEPFDAVVMNPPFTGGQDIKHIRHALDFLKRGGRLVAIAGAGVRFRMDAAHVVFRDALDDLTTWTMDDLPAGTFAESGTDVSTVLITATRR